MVKVASWCYGGEDGVDTVQSGVMGSKSGGGGGEGRVGKRVVVV